MTDAEIGETIRWLCSIPVDAGVRLRIYCDECEMAFGAGHPANAGMVRRAKGGTLVECLQDLLGQKQEIDDWIGNREGKA